MHADAPAFLHALRTTRDRTERSTKRWNIWPSPAVAGYCSLCRRLNRPKMRPAYCGSRSMPVSATEIVGVEVSFTMVRGGQGGQAANVLLVPREIRVLVKERESHG
jgi:hypothetical protein